MPGPVTTPVPFASATSAVSTTTYTQTVFNSTVQGAALVVVCGSSGSNTSTGVTDSAGNTYHLVSSSGVNENVQCYVALSANELTGGVSSLTATWTSADTTQKNVIGAYVVGAISVDLTATNNGSSASATITGGTPAYQYEVGLAIIQGGAAGSGFNDPQNAAGGIFYSYLFGQFPASQQITTMFWTDLYWPQLPQTLTSTLSVSQQWAFLLVTLYVNPAVALAAAPSVPDYIAGYGPQQSDMQSLWASPLAFFQNRMVFRAIESVSATTLPSSGAVTIIGYDNILEDPWGGWNPSTFKWTPPAGLSGWFQVTVTVAVATPAALQIYLSAYIGGNAAYNYTSGFAVGRAVLPNAVNSGAAEGSYILWLTGGQDAVWGAGAVANSSSNVLTNLTAGLQSSMEIVWLGS